MSYKDFFDSGLLLYKEAIKQTKNTFENVTAEITSWLTAIKYLNIFVTYDELSWQEYSSLSFESGLLTKTYMSGTTGVKCGVGVNNCSRSREGI